MTLLRVDHIHGHPGADSLRIEAGSIVDIGTLARSSDDVAVGGAILPGLRDSHVHLMGIAARAGQLDLSMARSLGDVIDLIGRHSSRLADGVPVIAGGVDEERLVEGRLPTRSDLDEAAGDRPVLAYRQCLHIASANTAALSAAGVSDATGDPPDGRLRRSGDGSISGVLEESAIAFVSDALAAKAPSPDRDAVLAVMHRLRRQGIVAVDAMVATGSSMWCTGGDELATIAAIGDESPVTVDVFVITDDPETLRRGFETLQGSGRKVRFAGWKGFADGSLGGHTAALRAPYADDPGTSGFIVGARLDELAETAVGLGGMAAIHAIGDLAVDRALAVANRLGPGTVRIEHASVADPDQVHQMAAAGVTASVQPSFVTSDGPWLERRLGVERSRWAYPFRSMLEAGTVLRGGSDAPVESTDPFVGIANASLPRPEALGVSAAVDMYAAGSLEIGRPATFIVTDTDPTTLSPTEVAAIEVRQVWIDGRRVE